MFPATKLQAVCGIYIVSATSIYTLTLMNADSNNKLKNPKKVFPHKY